MAIHAQNTAFRSTAQFPDFKVTSPLLQNQILVYSATAKAFVNQAPSTISGDLGLGGGGGGISSASNLGLGAGVFKQINVTDLELRSIVGGTGLTAVEGTNEITISNDIITSESLSVPTSLQIVIDNDDNSITERMEVFRGLIPASLTLTTEATTTTSTLDLEVIIGDPGEFRSSTADFVADGFVAGMCIRVDGTDNHDGVYELATVLTNRLILTTELTGTGGFQPITSIDGIHFNITTVDTIVLSPGTNLVTEGFLPGQVITILNTTNGNDGTYTVEFASANVLVIEETFTGTLGCDVGTSDITIIAAAAPTAVGWWVNETGGMAANDTTITGTLTIAGTGDIVVGNDITAVGTITATTDLILGTVSVTDLINASAISAAENGFLSQTSPGVVVGRELTSGTGITIVNSDGVTGDPLITPADFDITLTGDATGTNTVTGLSNTSITVTLAASGVTPGIFNSVTVDSKGRVTDASVVNNQPLDTDLTVLAGGLDASGIVVWTGDQFIDRAVLGTTDEITVIEGLGATGDIVVGLSDDIIMPGIASATLPRGTTGQRSGSPVGGMIRYNTELDTLESYNAGSASWETTLTSAATDFVAVAGDTMTGDLTMGANNIIITGLVDGRDVSADGVILDAINTGTGIKAQTAADTFENRTITAEANEGITVADGDGVAGNPTIGFDMTAVTNWDGDTVNQNVDRVLILDVSTGFLRKATPNEINRRQAFQYFMAQV